MDVLKRFFQSAAQRRLVWALAFTTPLAINAADTGKTFATPEAAVSALVAAASAKDTNALRDIFGPATADNENETHSAALVSSWVNKLPSAASRRGAVYLPSFACPSP